jgi:hypothetical protein
MISEKDRALAEDEPTADDMATRITKLDALAATVSG